MDLVKVICYGDVEKMERNKAIKLYTQCVACSEGAERERYMNVLTDLTDGRSVAFDRVDAPKGYHACPCCDSLVKGTDDDVMCTECSSTYGHTLFSEL